MTRRFALGAMLSAKPVAVPLPHLVIASSNHVHCPGEATSGVPNASPHPAAASAASTSRAVASLPDAASPAFPASPHARHLFEGAPASGSGASESYRSAVPPAQDASSKASTRRAFPSMTISSRHREAAARVPSRSSTKTSHSRLRWFRARTRTGRSHWHDRLDHDSRSVHRSALLCGVKDRAEVVVIGAGIMGLSIAYHLARLG